MAAYKDIQFAKFRFKLNGTWYYPEFTYLRVDRTTLPAGKYAYDIRHTDDDWCEPCSISTGVLVNHYGTVVVSTDLKLKKEEDIEDYEHIYG